MTLPSGLSFAVPQAVGFATEEATTLPVAAANGPARVAVIMGQQLNQPVHAHGPLMLASPAALERARDYVATLAIPAPNLAF